ncbi:MAG: hypothetical protein A2Y10_17125 [Planctomycetes bacterium GWF2_41_51]|nr:MAG: hypothetical protein A2Y10_17125 [Planctomycetes bacterium GWF2_41_51]
MKNRIKWMVLAMVMLVCSSVWADLFNPDTDPNLKFNLNFESTPTAITTVDDAAGTIGTLWDYNTIGQSVWRTTNVIRGSKCADFNDFYDAREGAGETNDVSVRIPPNGSDLFEFGNGFPGTDKTTISFWFNMPDVSTGTFIRHESSDEDPSRYYWEIHAISKLEFRHGLNGLRYETADTLSALGVTNNTWHHAALVIDRTNCVVSPNPTMRSTCKMYIDGAEVPVIITYFSQTETNLNIDTMYGYYSPLWVGCGSRNFDGMMDEVRFYRRALSALDVSLLYQYNPGVPHVTAIRPIPSSSNVAINSGISWRAYAGASTEKLYFGTDPENLTAVAVHDANKASNAQLGGQFTLGQTYYWYVKSTVSGVDISSPVWSFTAETGEAINPVPVDHAEDIEVSDVNIYWTGSTTALNYDVYYATDRSLVEALDASVKIKTAITAQQVNDVNSKLRGCDYYWRVVTNFASESVAGEVWTFRTRPYELIFNTRRNHVTRYQDYDIPALTCSLHSDGWTDVVTGSLDTDANVAVFNFPSGFNYDRRYDITVVPIYEARDINSTINARPVSIRVTGDFYFDGRIRIAGEDILTTTNDRSKSCSGGYPGPMHNSNMTDNFPDNICWTDTATAPAGFATRFGTMSSQKFWLADSNARNFYGPGISKAISPYKTGGGGGSGGQGGNCGRGYMHGLDCTGPSYGDKEIPIPMGGSAGGWGSVAAGCAGGGAIEIIATGNVIFDSNSEIRATGGNSAYGAVDKSSGTGSGGGGGGGRIAIYYGGTYTNTGVISAQGGAKGVYSGGTVPISLGEDGQTGTIYIVDSDVVSPKKASAPTPKNGDVKAYIGTAASNPSFQLRWYSGFGATNDRVWFGTSVGTLAPIGTKVTATRGQHTATVSVQKDKTYYWQVKSDSNSIPSDIWSFSTVNWQCPLNAIVNNHLSGPVWDINYDCVLNDADFWYFAKDWRVPRVTGTLNYTLDNTDWENGVPRTGDIWRGDLWRFANEWLECINRTNSGCLGL